MAEREDRTRWGLARMAVLARREEIEDALKKGEPVLSIWTRLFGSQNRPPLTYKHFAKLVRRYIRSGETPLRKVVRRAASPAKPHTPKPATINPNPKIEDFE